MPWPAIVVISLVLLCVALVWNCIAHWFCRPLRRMRIRDLNLRACEGDIRVIEDWARAVNQGVDARLRRPRGRWMDRCEAAPPAWRPQMIEGAAFAAGALRATYDPWRRKLPCEVASASPHHAQAAFWGAGLWGAFRYGTSFEDFLCAVQSYEPWWRFVCADGYGFKFGLLDYHRDPSSLGHLHAIPGYYRRAAFQGVGRAFYLGYLSDRRGLIETISDYAPQHDADLIEGAAFAAAYYQPDLPRRALRFVRAMPYEWRANAHLGITLGFRARAIADPNYFETCLTDLPRQHAAAIHHAVALAGDMEEQIRRDHRASGYGLWREKLAYRMQHEGVWEPAYVDVPEQSRSDATPK